MSFSTSSFANSNPNTPRFSYKREERVKKKRRDEKREPNKGEGGNGEIGEAKKKIERRNACIDVQ